MFKRGGDRKGTEGIGKERNGAERSGQEGTGKERNGMVYKNLE
jgi:hypothetical protein